MTAECLGLEYEFKVVDLMAGEHMKPEFLAMNPQHNIPTVKDGDFVMNESRAVAGCVWRIRDALSLMDWCSGTWPTSTEPRARSTPRMPRPGLELIRDSTLTWESSTRCVESDIEPLIMSLCRDSTLEFNGEKELLKCMIVMIRIRVF